MIFYVLAALLGLFGAALVLVAVSIRETRAVVVEDDPHYRGDVGLFIVGIALLCIALVAFAVTYLVRNAL